ncbi:MAG: rod shape-determining protein RodA [Microcystis panniformis Mp_MB_F_20051200_S9]|uniref:Peptidoglycan glycosyltransferase RodA n=1 Tax=Microcystis panniformis Mp_MB_F_20051200_S9 TaxID=2486223 RepID=A0A552PNP3_9CHRO|nr:MAG: rod shape-determining protein RodA [Microcystis panniformis Mp_MB_F_20080800_S26D]TRV52457.1 MAG: rod shape-determining protein RodA [Microcystis panniformis Mp_GB_SS_20050300_S99D]TRV54458.1 MAG: rod shape-determining protein RodA [Microcystis panniformis Mp_GB_SS_20050300_S99]TRV58604.1 MAG: rod shape-determining protein RodA [Microcystis panniformis Mp_MB_F_20051200_S9]TRV59260.1 MAG: rod shape-determining protein RodA [Microcystis panniformis Mp_MB_F_20080800_S26]TRV62185.1 MAG: ro
MVRRQSLVSRNLRGFNEQFSFIFRDIAQIDWLLFVLVTGLTVFGGLMIRSAERHTTALDWWQHWLFGCVGVAIALFLARCRYESLLKWHWLTYLLTNLSLIAVIILGVTANGAQSWINIGSFNVQPSEFAKVGLIITLAALLHHRPADNLFAIAHVFVVTAIPWVLIMAQPDLGTGLVFGAITLGMIYWANAKLPWMIILLSPLASVFLFNLLFPAWIVLAIIIAVLAWFTLPYRFLSTFLVVATNLVVGKLGEVFWGLLKEYQKDRLTLFLDPEKNPLGGGYQLIQSRIAIGSGELLGRGLHQGTQTQLNFIPEQHTDFIFSVVGEEFGFVGSILVLIAFWLVCWRLLVIANTAKENFGSLIAIGVLSMIAFQAILNISMTVGLAPITGIPLPWLSYGRSSLLTNFIALGLVESVANYRPRKRLY